MKKIFPPARWRALLLLLSLCAPLAAAEEAVIDVPRCAAAPEIDGIIGPDEYVCLRSYASGGLTLLSGSGRQPTPRFYAGWDDEYFYFAVRVSCQAPHSSYQDDEAGHYIFNGHSLMTALVPEDPAADKYRPSNGEYWLWQEAYDAGVCFEWTTILDSRTRYGRDRKPFPVADRGRGLPRRLHERGRTASTCTMRIAFSAFSTEYAGAAFEAQSGAVFGLDFNAGLSDVGVGYDGERRVPRRLCQPRRLLRRLPRNECVRLRAAAPGRDGGGGICCGDARTPATRAMSCTCLRSSPSARRWRSGSPVPQEQRHRRRGR